MSERKTGITKNVWMLMLLEGGHWTVPELREALGTEKRIDRVLSQLADGGFCNRKTRTDRINGEKYGVTPSCRVPQDVTVAEIAAAINGDQHG